MRKLYENCTLEESAFKTTSLNNRVVFQYPEQLAGSVAIRQLHVFTKPSFARAVEGKTKILHIVSEIYFLIAVLNFPEY